MSDLLSVSDALARLLAVFNPTPLERLPLAQALGRVTASEISASLDLPPFTNSAMDGFALRAVDVAGASRTNPQTLAVAADIPAGASSSAAIAPGQAARIMTGAAIPAGADAVIPVEDTDCAARGTDFPLPAQVRVYRALSPGAHIRRQGEDTRAGDLLFQPGCRLRPQDVGLLAMLGVSQAPVHRLPQAAIVSSGDELLPVEETLRPGFIHDSNTYMLAALVESAAARPFNLGVAADRPEAVQERLDRAAALGVDLILSSAGVSVGAFDYVRQVVQAHGQLDFWRVNMRPGKPIAFGAYRGIPFIGLPGNPVSAFVGFEVFVRPALYRLAGLLNWRRQPLRVRLLEPLETDGRETFLRAFVHFEDGEWQARLAGHQGSGNLRGFTLANALLIVPSAVKSPPTGAELDAWLLDDPR